MKLYLLLSSMLLAGCSSVLIVKSNPMQADVFLEDPISGEKKILGKTPFEVKASFIKEIAGESVLSGDFYFIVIEKPQFITQKLLIPASRFGTLVTSLDVKLKQGNSSNEERLARDILNRIFLAQKMALSRQYERAHTEVDRILVDFPNFPRALSMRASIYYMQKNYQESLKWFEQAIAADPQMEEAIKMLAKIRSLQQSMGKQRIAEMGIGSAVR